MYNQTIVLGVLVSLFYTELTGLSAGLILPGYLVLNLGNPWRVASTLLVALLSVGACRLLARGVILYGRRRFAAHILLSFLLSLALGRAGLLPGGASVIGYIIPGILARELDRQGIWTTLLSLCITTGLLALLLVVVSPTGWM